MPISGLALILSADADARGSALRALEDEPAIELGPCEGARQAAVLETDSEEHNKRIWTWLRELEGVEHVDVVFVSVETARTMSDVSDETDVPGPADEVPQP